MRFAMIGIGLAAMAFAAGVQPGNAAWGNSRYCTAGGGGGSSGEMICSYNTWEQCMASASGLGRYCTENPAIEWAKRGYGTWPESTQGRGHRRGS